MTNRTGIRALFGANAISQSGNRVTYVAVPWFVLQTTGSAAKTGLVAAAFGLGLVVPSVLGGPLVDRLGYKRTSILSDTVCGLIIGCVPVLALSGVLTFWELLLCVFLLASVNALGGAARSSLVPTLAEQASMAMERANAIDQAIARFAQLVGPVLAGLLIAVVGAANALFVDAGSFAVSALVIAVGLSPVAHDASAAKAEEKHGYIPELLEGLRYVWSNRLILSLVLLVMATNFLDVPLSQVILPVYAKTFFGNPATLGAMLGAFAAGAVLGTMLFGVLARRLPRRATFLACYVLAPLVIYGALAAQLPFALIIVAAVLGGIIAGPINPLFMTVIQENTPAHMRGRVFGVLSAIAQSGIAVGAIVVGVAIDGAGVIATVIGMGVAYVLITLGMSLNPALRGMGGGHGATTDGMTVA